MVACTCANDFASKANRRVVIQSLGTVPDDAGGRVETWADVFNPYAVIEPMAGKEIFVSSQLQSRVDARITIRYRSAWADTTLAAKYRVKNGARLYNVKYVKNLADDMKTEGNAFQQLLCTEGEPS